jgi:hypothetical protein
MRNWLVDSHQRLWAFDNVLGSNSLVRPTLEFAQRSLIVYLIHSQALMGGFS